MKELIKIEEREGKQVVSARELYKFLEIKTDFSHWMKRMLEYGFEEDKDFTSFLTQSTGGRPSSDYALTLDTAKQIAMIQRSDKGKQARLYFIEIEKKYNSLGAYLNDPIMMIRKQQIDTNKKLDSLEQRQDHLEKIVSVEMKVDKKKLREMQMQLDRLWDISDREDLYR